MSALVALGAPDRRRGAARSDVRRRSHQLHRAARRAARGTAQPIGGPIGVARRPRCDARRARRARAHPDVFRRGARRARGSATPACASPTSSTSASADRTWVRPWSRRRWRRTRARGRALHFVSNVDGTHLAETLRPLASGDHALHGGVEDVHHAGDDDQRALGAASGSCASAKDDAAIARALRRNLDQRGRGPEVRHRAGEHVRVLGLGRRPLLAVVVDRPADRAGRRLRALRAATRRRARDGRALPHRAASSRTCRSCSACSGVWYASVLGAESHAVLAVRAAPAAPAGVSAAARHGEQRQARRSRRARRDSAHRARRLGRARHQRPACVLSAAAPGHAADAVRLPGRHRVARRARRSSPAAASPTALRKPRR